jgi:hypothetical protein
MYYDDLLKFVDTLLGCSSNQSYGKMKDFFFKNRNRQRKILMLIFSSTERPSQGLGGQLGDPGARAIQVV